MTIDPFELHPETPRINRSLHSRPVTVGEIKNIVDDLAIQVWTNPGKLWGHGREDIERWLRMVVSEAEKIVIKNSDRSG